MSTTTYLPNSYEVSNSAMSIIVLMYNKYLKKSNWVFFYYLKKISLNFAHKQYIRTRFTPLQTNYNKYTLYNRT